MENTPDGSAVEQTFDIIIIGAGSAGCLLSNRLSEDGNLQILLLEAGGEDRDPWLHIPLAWGKILQERKHDWGYFTEPEPHANSRKIECARAKTLGGCSSTNAMAFVRGHPNDFNRWSRNGLDDWAYEKVLPYFKSYETWLGEPSSDKRGQDGPMFVTSGNYTDPLVHAYLKAANALGFSYLGDFNSGNMEGFGNTQHTIYRGRRFSAAQAFLRPARSRRNLTVRTHARVTKINFDLERAKSVSYAIGGTRYTARARKEIVVAAGAINTPQLLMLSGIGSAQTLRQFNIPIVRDLTGVGRNLQDHISAGVTCNRTTPGPFVAQMRFDRLLTDLVKCYFFGKGRATSFPTGYMGFTKLDPQGDVPDIQFLFAAGSVAAHPWFPGIRQPFANSFGCRAVLLHPKSRGHIDIQSPDPQVSPRIHQNFFDQPEDMDHLRNGLRLVRQIFNQSELDNFRGKELLPGEGVDGDADLNAYIRESCITVHHPCGTCRMGTDGDAVVGPDLKVRGVKGLRVVDASVMPDLVSGNINATVYMIAEKASALIKQDGA